MRSSARLCDRCFLDSPLCACAQQMNSSDAVASSPDDFRSEMFRRETVGAATAGAARSAAAADGDGVSTWLHCSAASGACADRCKRARPGPYTPVAETSSGPPSRCAGGLVDNAPDARTPAPVCRLDAAGPSAASPALTPVTSHGCYANAPASPIDLTGYDEAGSPAWHVVPPALPPRPDPGPSPHGASCVDVPHLLQGTVAETEVLTSPPNLLDCRPQIRLHPEAHLAWYG